MRRLKEKFRKVDKKDAAVDAVGLLQRALDACSDAAGDVGVPGLQKGVGVLSTVLGMIQKAHANTKDIEELANRIRDLTAMIHGSVELQGSSLSSGMQGRLDRLLQSWDQVNDEAQQLASRNRLIRIVKSEDDAKKIGEFVPRLLWSIQSFMVESNLAIEFALDEHSRFAKESSQRVERKLDVVLEDVQRLRMLSRPEGNTVPPYALTARFDRPDERVACLEGTRTAILDQVSTWATENRADHTDDQSSRPAKVLWLNGIAGTGKTTIAYTIAERCHKQGILGASFFCSRSDTDCSSANLIFPTIAYQLGLFHGPFRDRVADALQKDPLVAYAGVSRQLEALIVQPLVALGTDFPSCVVVIDALDECRDPQATSAILSSLLKHAEALISLSFLVTSRPEAHIVTSFEAASENHVSKALLLHEVPLQTVTADIQCYLSSQLSDIRANYMLENSWPDEADVTRLAELSEGLFVFAATAVKFIADKNYSDPEGQLKILTSRTANPGSYHLLDQLYTQVLETAFPDASRGISGRIKSSLGSIALLEDPLPLRDLASLIGLSPRAVHDSLMGLHSLLVVPDIDHATATIRVIHPTLPEYLLDPRRCTNKMFVVHSHTQHTLLLLGCLNAMKELRSDICNIRNPSLLNSEIQDLPERVARAIPQHLMYACRHWVTHLSGGELSDNLLDALMDFGGKRLLFWLEVCSLTGILREAISALNAAQCKLSTIRDTRALMLSLLLNDFERLVIGFLRPISTSALQLYHGVLAFVPKKAPLAEVYGVPNSVRAIRNGVSDLWNTYLSTVVAHDGEAVDVVHFSHDGLRFVSAGGDVNAEVRIWDALTCTLLLAIPSHGNRIYDIKLSPDAIHVAAASNDGTIRVWDASSGILISTLEGHSGPVHSIAYTPDGFRIISGSRDHTVKIWDTLSGACLETLKTHPDAVHCVSVSLDGLWMASSSTGGRVDLFSLEAPYPSRSLKLEQYPGLVYTLAFTPDSNELVTGPSESPVGTTTSAWDVRTGKRLRGLVPRDWPHMYVGCLAISGKGDHFICSTLNRHVFAVDITHGYITYAFKGHIDRVTSISYNGDGTRFVSGSLDGTIRVWDVQYNMNVMPYERASWWAEMTGYSGDIHIQCTSASFSHDSRRLVTSWSDWTVEVEDTRSWEQVYHYQRKPMADEYDSLRCVAFSPDGSVTVAALKVGGRLLLLDATTGAVRAQIPGTCHVPLREISGEDERYVEDEAVGHPQLQDLQMWHGVLGTWPHCFGGPSSAVTFSQDSRYLLVGSASSRETGNASDNRACLWDVSSGKRAREYVGHSGPVLSVAFSLDARLALTGSADTHALVWDVESGEVRATLKGHTAGVTSVAFSPQGHRIASGSMDATVRVWDPMSGEQLQLFNGHSMAVWSLSFAPDGNVVISSSEDRTMRFWDVATGDHLLSLDAQTWHNTLSLSHDGSGIIVDSNTGRAIHLWDAGLPESQTDASLPWLPRRTWPIYFIEDEWLFSITPTRRTRLCWIPMDWRSVQGYSGSCIVLARRHTIDVTGLEAMLDTLTPNK